MPIALKNTQRRMQVFNLRHDVYCEPSGSCSCREQTVTTVEESPMTGERRPRSLKRKVPASLTFLALEKRDGMHEAVLKLPEVKRAVDRGELRVLTVAQPKLAAKPFETETRPKKDKERDKDK